MKHVLNAMNDDRLIRRIDVEYSLYPQQRFAVNGDQCLYPHDEAFPFERFIVGQAKGVNTLIMAVYVVMMAMAMVVTKSEVIASILGTMAAAVASTRALARKLEVAPRAMTLMPSPTIEMSQSSRVSRNRGTTNKGRGYIGTGVPTF